MQTATEVSLKGFFLDGFKVKAHHGRVLFLSKGGEYTSNEKWILWNTKDDDLMLETDRLDWKVASAKSRYFSIEVGYKRSGVLNTRTGDMFLSDEYQEVKHLRGQYFQVKTKTGKFLLIDAEDGRVADGEMKIIGKHAIVNGRTLIELATGKEIFGSEKGVSHLYGPYFLIGDEWGKEEQMIIHFRTSKKVVLPAIEDARYDVKHIGEGKFLVTHRVPYPKKRKHSILTFATGKMTTPA